MFLGIHSRPFHSTERAVCKREQSTDCRWIALRSAICGQVSPCLCGALFRFQVLFILDEFGVMRFNELSRAIPDISPKVLSGHLKSLESTGLVRRTIYGEVPPRTEYELTDLGRTLIPILNQLTEWGVQICRLYSKI